MRPGTSDTWLKAAFFAGVWVVGTWVVATGLVIGAGVLFGQEFKDGTSLILMVSSAVWFLFISGFASGVHDSTRVFWLTLVGFFGTGVIGMFFAMLLMVAD